MNPWKARGVPVIGRGDPALYAALRVFCACVLVPLYRYSVQGGAHVPASGGVILAVTHKSWGDPVLTAMAFRRPLRFMAKSELFGSRFFGRLVTTLGAFPINRGTADIEALRASLDIVADGGMLLMFPEGHRYHDDHVHEFHAGIGMLALRSGAPILPVALKGTRRLMDGGVPRFPRVRVVIGPPVDLSDIEGRRSAAYTAAAERLRDAVAELYERP